MPVFKVGIEPVSYVKDGILQIRSYISKKTGIDYQGEPCPHITLLINNYFHFNDLDGLPNVAGGTRSLYIETDGIRYFHHPEADKVIVRASVIKTPVLQQLQEDVADACKVRDGNLMKDVMEELPGFEYDGQEAENNRKFGFPYVGDNWKPSIGIAVVDPDRIKEFQGVWDDIGNLCSECKFPLMDLTLYEFRGKWRQKERYLVGSDRR
jgi:hypothetical protein